jgi:16S rRNA (guanine1516-N2)-methyltransferase
LGLATLIKDEHLCLIWEKDNQTLQIPLDWKQRKGIGLKSDLLKRALGKHKTPLLVCDGTAGLLRDAIHFVGLGHQVLCFEKNIDLAKALQQGLELLPIEGLRLLAGDFVALAKNELRPDIVYLDPMFPEKKKTALAGKESQLLQSLCAYPEPAEEEQLLDAALATAKSRVIVKRPRKAKALACRKPHHEILGKAVRYDVYLVNEIV